MLDCLILGDSIAIGTKKFYNECNLVARANINSQQFNVEFPKIFKSQHVIISLGTNDLRTINTFKELLILRNRIDADSVTWLLPACNDKFCKSHINEIIEIIAKNKGDHIIKTNKLQSDKIHPSWAGYKEIVNQHKHGK